MTSTQAASFSRYVAYGAVAALVATTGYCVYFDHKRRNDPVFRKRLDIAERRVEKAKRLDAQRAKDTNRAALRRAVSLIDMDELKANMLSEESMERFFLDQLTLAETLISRGEEYYVPAVLAFYKAFISFPRPQELLTVYRQIQPTEVYEMFMEVIATQLGGAGAASRSAQPRGNAILEEIDQSDPPPPSAPQVNGQTSSQTSSPKSGGSGTSYVQVERPQGSSPAADTARPQPSAESSDPPESAI
ncbi:uncharacterized protein L969DRAFT_94256 [Mixia osmundae IAM 14324]|uniref:Mitochondrial import receptor subunit TOM20 n=1 Tax=Mixia osmundae (strain CBS 9802 / IAM 14324 / JCM 22182 / KY 12970) TaxID=764103 RepID=G7E8B4_MIXOS|nr:uncharacterized protein L969DRAFT_94256 [Mixia osmundae IAM 14324]KEI39177.1 hypothetical protein L969DRAFT_94256 [Mixia osmundae IAM 14324]GAA99074.1 hypothetical protein E5Q_05763 [Mixia osmundae IAM 14324]